MLTTDMVERAIIAPSAISRIGDMKALNAAPTVGAKWIGGITMLCNCYQCWDNEDGYCSRSSYVVIDEDGRCDSVYIPTEDDTDEPE